jgi:hypothetical protein
MKVIKKIIKKKMNEKEIDLKKFSSKIKIPAIKVSNKLISETKKQLSK